MATKKAPEAVVTKTGETVELNYCRKCMKNLPVKEFYECVDAGFIDSNGLMSVCKDCIQDIYDTLYRDTLSVEKSIHKICTLLNIRYSNEAMSATKTHIGTLLENGKTVNAVFSIYKMKLTATKKSMDKSGLEDMSYEDVGTIFTSEKLNTKEIPIPQEVVDFWGATYSREDIDFLERQYASFKQNSTNQTANYTEIVLWQQACYTLLEVKRLREAHDPDAGKELGVLQALLKNLAATPEAINKASSGAPEETDAFGLWIRDIEQDEPAQWLKSNPQYDMYRDVGNVEEYFENYIRRPLKNFVLSSKDWNVEDGGQSIDDMMTDEEAQELDILGNMGEENG